MTAVLRAESDEFAGPALAVGVDDIIDRRTTQEETSVLPVNP